MDGVCVWGVWCVCVGVGGGVWGCVRGGYMCVYRWGGWGVLER